MDSITEFAEEIKKVAKKMGVEVGEDNFVDPNIRKNGETIGFDAEKMRKFYAFKTDFDATGFIKGKVMTSKLCSCECEGYIVVRIYRANKIKSCVDYENCIDLYCFDCGLQCLELKPGDWIEAEIYAFGTLKETNEKEILIPPANKSEYYKMVGKTDGEEIDLGYFKLRLEDKLPLLSEYVELDCCIHIDVLKKLE